MTQTDQRGIQLRYKSQVEEGSVGTVAGGMGPSRATAACVGALLPRSNPALLADGQLRTAAWFALLPLLFILLNSFYNKRPLNQDTFPLPLPFKEGE